MFAPTDFPLAKAKAQNLQELMSKIMGDLTMEEYIIIVRAGYQMPHREDEQGNIIAVRQDMTEACYRIVVHRNSDNKHAEELWHPEFVDECLSKKREAEKALRRFTDAFDIIAAEETPVH